MALSMQVLTSSDTIEIKRLIDMLINSDADTGFMHEGFNKDNPSEYTREWFCWSDALFAEAVEYAIDKNIVQENNYNLQED